MGPHDHTESTTDTNPRLPGNKGQLNVILHGLFAFVHDDKKREITAHIPHMGSQHLYKAGNWLAETTLAEHTTLSLQGVTAGEAKFSSDQNITLRGVQVSQDGHENHSVYATLRLPYPQSLLSLQRLTIQTAGLGGDDDSKKKIEGFPKAKTLQTATVQVLSYDFESDAELRLGDHPWEPVLNDGQVNLHVFSEPERSVREDHIRHAFQASMGLFVGVDLTLKRPPEAARLEAESETIPKNVHVHDLELQDLVQRQRWLALLGRAIKEKRDVNTIWDDPTPFSGSDLNACCGSSCG